MTAWRIDCGEIWIGPPTLCSRSRIIRAAAQRRRALAQSVVVAAAIKANSGAIGTENYGKSRFSRSIRWGEAEPTAGTATQHIQTCIDSVEPIACLITSIMRCA